MSLQPPKQERGILNLILIYTIASPFGGQCSRTPMVSADQGIALFHPIAFVGIPDGMKRCQESRCN